MRLKSAHTVQSVAVLSLFFLATSALGAQGAALNNITLFNTNEDMLLYLTLEGAFSEKIKRAILSGMPTSFTYLIQLLQVHTLWPDEKIADIQVVHSIAYDTVRKEFTVRRSWKNNESEQTASFEEAQEWMSRIDRLKIIPLNRMKKGSKYQLRTKAEVSKKTLPFNLHTVLFFISLWDVETDWYIIDFTY
jgi:hypothetical protein